MRSYVMEFIGTVFLVLAIGLTGDPIAIGIMLMVMVYMGGHISGAHYNPAVTLAVWMRGKIEAKYVAGYMVSQIAGALAGAIICYWLQGSTFAPAPAESVGAFQAIVVETIFTFALASVILAVATTQKLEGNYIYGLAIGFTLLAIAYAGGGISGGAYNPAVGIGPILMDTMMGGSSMPSLVIYLIGPFLGGALAAIVFKYLNPEEA